MSKGLFKGYSNEKEKKPKEPKESIERKKESKKWVIKIKSKSSKE